MEMILVVLHKNVVACDMPPVETSKSRNKLLTSINENFIKDNYYCVTIKYNKILSN